MTKRSGVLAGTLGDAERGRMVITAPGQGYFREPELARHGGHRAAFGQHALAPYTVRQRVVIRTLIRSTRVCRYRPCV
jgi:hypothetical protein